MSADRRVITPAAPVADAVVSAAAAGANETPGMKKRMDDIWGTESKSTEELEQTLNTESLSSSAANPAPPKVVEPPAPPPPVTKPGAPVDDPAVSPPEDVMPVKKEEVVPPALPADDDIPPDDIAGNPKQNNAWTKIRAEKKELKNENLRLQQELEAVKASAGQGAEAKRIEELESQVAQYEEAIGQYDITRTVAFNEKYVNPLVSRYKKMVGLLSKGSTPEEADKVARKLLETGVDRDALISGYPITVQAAVGSTLAELDDLQAQRDEAIKNWRETKAVLNEQESRQGLSQLNKAIVEDTNKAVEALRMEGNYLYMLSQTDDNWNNGVKERITALQGILKTGGREDMVKYIADGLTARMYRDWYQKEHIRAEKLAAQINARVQSAPDLGGNDTGALPVDDKPKKPRSMGSVLDTVWGKDERF